jgi:MFS family permease
MNAGRRVTGGSGLVGAAVAAVAFSTTLNAIGVFTEEEIHWLNLLVGFAVALAGAALVFGWFSRRAARRPKRAWRTGLVCGVIGLLLVAAFWSGLPPIFAAASIYLGVIARRAGSSGAGSAAIALGALAVAADVAAYATDVASRF